jgi:hypothetical protein
VTTKGNDDWVCPYRFRRRIAGARTKLGDLQFESRDVPHINLEIAGLTKPKGYRVIKVALVAPHLTVVASNQPVSC